METIFPNCAGLDVHKKSVTVCHRWLDERGQSRSETRTFSTITADLESLATWLLERGCTHIAMESTGVYWQPIYHVLEGRFVIWLVNARHVRKVPGRKTDVTDAEWLAQLLQHGLLRPSMLPPQEQRELRDLVRYRLRLVDERTRILNRIQKVLEDANLKLMSVVTQMDSLTAQAIVRALAAGEQDPAVLADLARGKLRQKREALERALVGTVRPHHRFLLTHLLIHLDFVEEEIAALETQVEQMVAERADWQAALERLDTIPGVGRQTALLILAEVGIDMSRFPDAKHLAAWAGLAPGNNESGGKQRPAPSRAGNRYLRRGLVQAARAAGRSKASYFRALYYRIAQRRGKKRAAVAVARTILEIAYYLLVRGETYRELGVTYLEQQDRARTARRLVRRLSGLGYDVSISELAATDGSG